jgi:hypothetical protein
MSKFKPAKAKGPATPQIKGGLPCVILVIMIVVFVSILLFLVMKYAA